MNDDLKDYRAPLGAFQLIDCDQAAFILIVIAAAIGFFWGV